MTRGRHATATAALILTAGAVSGCGDGPLSPDDIAQEWLARAPDDVGMDASLLDRADAQAQAIPRFRSLLVARRGALVMERYYGGAERETLHDVRSVTKSIVSALVGIAHAEGLLPNLDTSMAVYLAGYALDTTDFDVSVRDLLTMTSGYEWDETTADGYNTWITASGDRAQYVLDRPQVATPGANFRYNSGAVHVLGVVLSRATGMSVPEYAARSLFEPIGIEQAAWETLDPGTVNGGSGIDLRARDLLRIGQLLLQRGRSGGRQVVPPQWVTTATSPFFPWRIDVGAQTNVSYGYLWWVSDAPPANTFFAWGYGGQFIYVVPDEELVVVTTTDWRGVSADVGADALEAAALDIIVNDVLAAAR